MHHFSASFIHDIELTVETYEACGGKEHFIAFEDLAADVLIGFARLRFPAAPHRPELQDAALIRELHVYGSMGDREKGYEDARKLLAEHRQNLVNGLIYVKEKGVVQLENIQYFDAGSEIKETIVGIIAGMEI